MSRKILEEFIDLYKSYPCLNKIQWVPWSTTTGNSLQSFDKKIKGIGTRNNQRYSGKENKQFKKQRPKEKKKYESSLKSGASADDVYWPKLWYYDMISFLSDQEAPQKSTSNLDIQEESILEVGKIITYSYFLNCIINFNNNHINFIKIVLYCRYYKKTFYLKKKTITQ